MCRIDADSRTSAPFAALAAPPAAGAQRARRASCATPLCGHMRRARVRKHPPPLPPMSIDRGPPLVAEQYPHVPPPPPRLRLCASLPARSRRARVLSLAAAVPLCRPVLRRQLARQRLLQGPGALLRAPSPRGGTRAARCARQLAAREPAWRPCRFRRGWCAPGAPHRRAGAVVQCSHAARCVQRVRVWYRCCLAAAAVLLPSQRRRQRRRRRLHHLRRALKKVPTRRARLRTETAPLASCTTDEEEDDPMVRLGHTAEHRARRAFGARKWPCAHVGDCC
jgi:hypothetical protein